MQPALIAVNTSDLPPQAKWLFSILYSYADNGVARVDEGMVATLMGIGFDTLRRWRCAINNAGFAHIQVRGGQLLFVLADHLRAAECAPGARSVHQAREVCTTCTPLDEEEVAAPCEADVVGIVNADEVPAPAAECAPGARSVHQAREVCTTCTLAGPAVPPTPPSGRLVNILINNGLLEPTEPPEPGGGAGGTTGAPTGPATTPDASSTSESADEGPALSAFRGQNGAGERDKPRKDPPGPARGGGEDVPGAQLPGPEPGDVARSLRLLQDREVGLGERQARRLAESYGFAYLLRQVLTWRRELRQRRVAGPGALVTRCDMVFRADELPADYLTDPLYQRAAGIDEHAARRLRYVPAGYDGLIEH